MNSNFEKGGTSFQVRVWEPHPKQQEFLLSPAKRKIIRAGRRGGKTTGCAILAVQYFLAGRRVLYATPTTEQIGKFWKDIKRAFDGPIEAGLFYKNETEHIIERLSTEQRIRAKTAWNADTLRGDYADLLILDEWQLMDEDAWELVGAPMLLDNNGDAVFIYTPPSIHTRSASKARDLRHAAKMFKVAQADTSGRWAAFHFSSHDNPHVSAEALAQISGDMTQMAYRQEILAEDLDEVPGALWSRPVIERTRVRQAPALARIIIGVDPSVTNKSTSDEAGIIVAGLGLDGHGYILADRSRRDSPNGWATAAVTAYREFKADRLVAEVNNGGEMVELTIRTVDPNIAYKSVVASRGKVTRAEPISALYEKGRIHHVGDELGALEDELVSWVPGDSSPNRLDACVFACTELLLHSTRLGLLEYLKQEKAKADGYSNKLVESAAEPQACPSCGSVAIVRLYQGKRCNQCGVQFGEPPVKLPGPTRREVLASLPWTGNRGRSF